MDKIINMCQFILSVLILLGVVASVTGHAVMGHLTTLIHWVVAALFLCLTWIFVRISWNELNETKK